MQLLNVYIGILFTSVFSHALGLYFIQCHSMAPFTPTLHTPATYFPLSQQLDLGCDYGLAAPGILDFKNSTLMPLPRAPRAPATANEQHVVYLIDKDVQKMDDILGPGGRPFNMTSSATPTADCPSKYCWSLNWINYEASTTPLVELPPFANLPSNTYVQVHELL